MGGGGGGLGRGPAAAAPLGGGGGGGGGGGARGRRHAAAAIGVVSVDRVAGGHIEPADVGRGEARAELGQRGDGLKEARSAGGLLGPAGAQEVAQPRWSALRQRRPRVLQRGGGGGLQRRTVGEGDLLGIG